MKATKTIQLIISLWLIMSIAGGCNQLAKTEAKKTRNLITILSGPITAAEAKALRANYTSPEDVDALHTTDDEGDPVVLKGFVFGAEDLRTIMDKNAALKPGEKADSVIFYFGKDLASSKPNISNWHIIAYGMLGNQLLQTSLTGGEPTIMDKADPCPPYCPK